MGGLERILVVRNDGAGEQVGLYTHTRIHRRLIYKGDTSTHAQGTDPRVAHTHMLYAHMLLGLEVKQQWTHPGRAKRWRGRTGGVEPDI